LIEACEGDPEQIGELIHRKLDIPGIERIKGDIEGDEDYFLGCGAETDAEVKKEIEDLRNLGTCYGVDMSFYDKINVDGGNTSDG
jgi:hypothetical protein